MRTIDPYEVYQRALKSPDGADALDEVELLIYALKELETYIAMQGWTGFFTGSCVYLYPNVRRCLELSGHARSLAILDDYVEYLSPGGGPLDASTIEGLASDRRSDGPSTPDWGAQFQADAAERWQSLERYLATQGIRLIASEESPETSDRVQSLAAELAALIESNPVKAKQGESN